jgi:hypothetical protein
MIKFFTGLLILHFSILTVFAQKATFIDGYVNDSLKQPLSSVNVILRESVQERIVAFAYTDFQGYFKLSFTGIDTLSYILSANLLGYEKQHVSVRVNDTQKQVVFFLTQNQNILEEVRVKSEPAKVVIKEDTVTYKAAKFGDGTEKTVEDLLRKMPGIEVGENGTVFFKGKSVEKILIDGDDLLEKNYKLATRSMTADLIDEVEAIENFSENGLLKGIDKSDKTVLNLTIKEERKKFLFGNIDVSAGSKVFRDATINLFSYAKKSKVYVFGKHNNIGKKTASEQDFTSVDDLEFTSSYTKDETIIHLDNSQTSSFKPDRTNINQEFLASINSTHNFRRGLKTKTNLSIYKDRNNQFFLEENKYTLPNRSFIVSRNSLTTQKPLIGSFRLEGEHYAGINSRVKVSLNGLLSQSEFNYKTIFKTDSIRENLNERLQNSRNLFAGSVSYTHRLQNKKVFLAEINYLNSQVPQSYQILTDSDRYSLVFGLAESYLNIQQTVSSSREDFDASIKLLGLYKKSSFRLKSGFKYNKESVFSGLSLSENQNSFSPAGYANDLSLYKNTYYFTGSNRLSLGRVNIVTDLTANYLRVSNPFRQNFLYFEPSLSILSNISRKSKLTLRYAYNQIFSNGIDVYSGFILSGFRSFQRGIPQINSQKQHSVFTSFLHIDPFDQFTFLFTFLYSSTQNPFSNSFTISQNFDISSLIITPKRNTFNISSTVTKFFTPVSGNVKFEININSTFFENQANTSELRKNNILNTRLKLAYTSAYESMFNFSLGFEYRESRFKSRISSLENSGKNFFTNLFINLRLKRNRYFAFAEIEQYAFEGNFYRFVDAEVRYDFISKKLSGRIFARNLLNIDQFRQFLISDYVTSQTQYSLIQRYIMLGFNYSF